MGTNDRPAPSAARGLRPGLHRASRLVGRENMFDILGWIIFGLLVGLLARLLHPGKDPAGFAATIVLGIAGALLGGLVGRAIGWYGPNEGAGYVVATVGAVVLLS